MPRFTPYHADLVRELALEIGDRVLVVSAGPGAEALAAARVVDLEGHVRATDRSAEMVRLCRQRIAVAGFADPGHMRCEVADADDTTGGPWDAVMCAFGLWQLDSGERDAALRAWAESLSEHGRVGILVWGPSEPNDPFELLLKLFRDLEPDHTSRSVRALAEPETMAAMLESAGLAVVRHAVVRHAVDFPSAEAFVRAMREGCVCRRVWEEIGDARVERVAAAFYDSHGGRDAPVSFSPAATLVIGARSVSASPSPRPPSRGASSG